MKSLNQFLTEGKNTHLTHIEDEIFDNGESGIKTALNFLESVGEMLQGNSDSSINVSTKFDGCLEENTKIITNEGIKTIKEIVESWHINKKLYVLGNYNNKNVWTPILDVLNTTSKKEWIEIEFSNNKKLILTEDHEIKTKNRGWIKARDIMEDDDLECFEFINKDG